MVSKKNNRSKKNNIINKKNNNINNEITKLMLCDYYNKCPNNLFVEIENDIKRDINMGFNFIGLFEKYGGYYYYLSRDDEDIIFYGLTYKQLQEVQSQPQNNEISSKIRHSENLIESVWQYVNTSYINNEKLSEVRSVFNSKINEDIKNGLEFEDLIKKYIGFVNYDHNKYEFNCSSIYVFLANR